MGFGGNACRLPTVVSSYSCCFRKPIFYLKNSTLQIIPENYPSCTKHVIVLPLGAVCSTAEHVQCNNCYYTVFLMSE